MDAELQIDIKNINCIFYIDPQPMVNIWLQELKNHNRRLGTVNTTLCTLYSSAKLKYESGLKYLTVTILTPAKIPHPKTIVKPNEW